MPEDRTVTDPTAPFDSGADPLAPPPARPLTPPPVPVTPESEASRAPAAPPEPDTAAGVGADESPPSPPRDEPPPRPGTSRPDGAPSVPGAHEGHVVDLPPLPRKRSLFYRVVSFSWELTLGVSLVLVILLASGVFFVVDWVKEIGPRYSAAEFYDEERFVIVVKDGDRIVYDTYLNKVGAWDHADCADIGSDTAIQDGITDAGCESGIEAVYDREDLEYMIYQRVLQFGDASSARAALKALGPQEELARKLRFSESYPDEATYGAVADTEERFLIVTVAALENDAKENRDECEEGIDTFHTSNLNFLVMDNL